MKKVNILLVASFLFLLGSCVEQLDIEPQQSIDAASALETAEDIESAIVGAYGIMHGGQLYGTNLNLVSELLGSTDYCQWRGTFQSYRQVMNKAMTIDNAEASRTWIAGYRAINVANNVLDNLAKVADTDLRAQFEAEAKFIRGIMMFELVRLYGAPWDPAGTNNGLGIVISTTSVDTEEEASVKGKRATVAETYAQILADLTAAEAELPGSYSGSSKFRATKWAAKAFLSRVYLQQSNFAKALEKSNEVIDSKAFTLNAALTSTFTNKFTGETIFEMYNNDQNNAGTANDGLTTFYASLPGIGRSDVRVLAPFAGLYEATDERLTQLIYIGTGARPGSRQTGKWTAFGQNIPVIRLAEMLLTRAECNFRLVSAVGATPLVDVNTVRLRARASSLAAVTLPDIIQERSLELCFEGPRIHEIKRLKLSTGTFPWDSPKLVFPIPEREIRANSELQQNPGY
jgi:hypothetical protein